MKKNQQTLAPASAPTALEEGYLAAVDGGILDFNLSTATRNSTKDVTRKNSGNTFMDGSFRDLSVTWDSTGGGNGGQTTTGAPPAGQQQPPAGQQ